jgi:quercetin dioxygenase-like cupin family protein
MIAGTDASLRRETRGMGIKITAEDVVLPETQGWGIVRLARGRCASPRPHSHPYDEYVFMLEGRCILRNAGDEIEYRAGDVGRFPRHEEHSAVEALDDTVYLWTRGDTPPELAERSS